MGAVASFDRSIDRVGTVERIEPSNLACRMQRRRAGGQGDAYLVVGALLSTDAEASGVRAVGAQAAHDGVTHPIGLDTIVARTDCSRCNEVLTNGRLLSEPCPNHRRSTSNRRYSRSLISIRRPGRSCPSDRSDYHSAWCAMMQIGAP